MLSLSDTHASGLFVFSIGDRDSDTKKAGSVEEV